MELEQTEIVAKTNSATNLDLGYVFSPPCHPNQLYHRQLDMTLHDTPTLRHYDPEIVEFRVAPDPQGNSVIKVRHPWESKKKHRVLVSRVIMKDRDDKVVEAFTFGGGLQIISHNEYTHCILKSPAPIISVDTLSQMETILIGEVEILLAERREVWDEEHPKDDFEKRLADTDPFMLYLASIKAIQEKFNRFPNPLPEYLFSFTHFLQIESSRLHKEGLWPLNVPTIPQLL
jgi:hypothetical protein